MTNWQKKGCLQQCRLESAPSEGEAEMRENSSPSEGGTRELGAKSRVQTLRGLRAITHLRKVRQKWGKTAHLRKVGRGSWERNRVYRRYRGLRAIAHLRKVRQKCGKTAHLRKVGRGSWKRNRGKRCRCGRLGGGVEDEMPYPTLPSSETSSSF